MDSCRTVMRGNSPSLEHYKKAFEEMELKWIDIFREGPARRNPLAQIFHNFNVEYDPDTHTASYKTTAAAAKITEARLTAGHARRRPGTTGPDGDGAVAAGSERNGGRGRGGGRNGGGRGGGRGGDGRAGDEAVTVKGNLALLEAHHAEVALAYHLQAFVSVEHLEHSDWSQFIRSKRWTMIHIIDVIHRAHALMDNWLCMQQQVEDHVTSRTEQDSTQLRDFPHFLGGCEGRLRLFMETLTPYRKVMLYILKICRDGKYRRHGPFQTCPLSFPLHVPAFHRHVYVRVPAC
jgi:hypothetical protein